MSTEECIPLQRSIPVRRTVDVFIAGGGPAGVAAAVAAARQGRTVYLAESHTCMGGQGTAGLVPAYMRFGDGINFLAGGIGEEVLRRLRDTGGTGPGDGPKAVHGSIGINAEALKRVYDDMLVETDADFTFHSSLTDVIVEDGEVVAAICAGKSGLFAVKASIFIDCTGDGDLATFAGATYEKGDDDGKMMPATLCSLWADVDFKRFWESGVGQGKHLVKAIADGVFTNEDRHLPGMWAISENIGGANAGHTFGVDGTDERSLTKALLFGRQIVLEYERYYKEYLQGFEKMQLVATGSLLGVRETRRIIGDYLLCLEDFKTRAVFDDEIGRFAYCVDIHAAKPDKKSFDQFVEEMKTFNYGPGESYGIPYRSLIPMGLNNVLVAGRCISTDRFLQSSVRVMPGCYITGQAAGVAAAIATERKTDTRGVPIYELQSRLAAMGAYLPNMKHSVPDGIIVPQTKTQRHRDAETQRQEESL